MSILRFLRWPTALMGLLVPGIALAQNEGAPSGIRLLECIGGVCEIPAGDGLGAFGFYFEVLYPYVIGMGSAVAVLMGLIGGIEWMTAGSDAGKVTAGRTRMLTSLGGLILLLLSSTILHTLNPTFFR